MRKLERLLLNAAIFFGWTFFSALSAGAMLYGTFELQRSIVAALIAAGLAFFTTLKRSDFGGGNGGAGGEVSRRENPTAGDGGAAERASRLGMVI
jgi:hypothetical protein